MKRRTSTYCDDERYHVYMLIGHGGNPIYIGQSYQLDRRLQSHSRDRVPRSAIDMRTRWEATHHVEVIECDSYDDMVATERHLIREHRPVLNKWFNPNWDKRMNTVLTVLRWDEVDNMPSGQLDLPIQQLVC